jgi:hypothetical protein
MSGEKNEGEFFNRFKRIYPIPEGVKQLDVYAMLIEAKKDWCYMNYNDWFKK